MQLTPPQLKSMQNARLIYSEHRNSEDLSVSNTSFRCRIFFFLKRSNFAHGIQCAFFKFDDFFQQIFWISFTLHRVFNTYKTSVIELKPFVRYYSIGLVCTFFSQIIERQKLKKPKETCINTKQNASIFFLFFSFKGKI